MFASDECVYIGVGAKISSDVVLKLCASSYAVVPMMSVTNYLKRNFDDIRTILHKKRVPITV